jgi:signal transduction histidine kinase
MSLLSQNSFETYLAGVSKSHDAIVIGDPDTKMIGASLLAPLISQEQVVGILVLHARRPSHFSSTVISTVTTFASQAALAIENARLQGQAIQSAAFSATLAERSRIARDLHDSVSQALFGIVLGARTLQAMPLDASGRHAATYTLDLSEAALAEMRALVFELDPETITSEGLICVLERQAAALCARHKIEVTLSLGEREPELPGVTKEALYRICIEAIQNIIKHAHASQVLIHLEVADPCVSLEVVDNGRGFNPNLLYPGQLGLTSMRTHAEQAGGSLHIHSEMQHGTSVRVVVPV